MIWLVVYISTVLFTIQQAKESQNRKELREVRYKAALKIIYQKYKWKRDRLKIYTDLVYNVNGGVIYEEK